MEQLYIAVAAISLLVVTTGLVNRRLEASVLTEPALAVFLGISLGPAGLHWLDLRFWGPMEDVLGIACRFTMGMALMASALRLPKSFPLRSLQSQTVLVVGGMVGTWAISSAVLYLVLDLPPLLALLVGAMVTPTDPVVASTMVSGQSAENNLPPRIRNALTFESGINDGLAFPFVLLPLLLITKPVPAAWQEWLLKGLLWETGGGLVAGLALGAVGGWLLHLAHQRQLISNKGLLSTSVALAFLVLGILELIHVNSILGVFVAGLMLNRAISRNEDLQEEKVQEIMERVFTIPVFVFFGLVLPWSDWLAMGWQALALVAGILFLRRLPVLLLLQHWLKSLPKLADVLIVGWFGPLGVAALYYSVLVIKQEGLEQTWPLVSLLVFGSVLVHGGSGYPLSRWYAKKTGYEGGEEEEEENPGPKSK